MSVKAVDLVRKIRDKSYRETKDLPLLEQIRIVRKKAASFTKKTKRPLAAER
jgi:hypothetical protein